MTSWDADALRKAFTAFFVERGHTAVPSAGLIPHDPRAPLFTNAGMNQFIPYFLAEETPPYRRATTVQRCVRIRGKHDDIELVGRTNRHLTFFEMLGNFSFGDYFKNDAIPWAWTFLTEVLELDPERLWVTVYETDDEAETIWRDLVGVPAERIQRMGEDNFWEMGETGPCGPCSELYYDRGQAWGEDGGPLHGGEERFVEIWNLVFTQLDRLGPDELVPLPRPNIDTGAGLERILTVLEDVPTVWETNELRSLIASAEELTGRAYGDDGEIDVALRILADHARSVTFLVSDGVFPSNEGRGYVLRRIVRRAVLRAYQLGVESAAMSPLVAAVIAVMGGAYPKLADDAALIEKVVAHEEEAFRRTLKAGTALLEEALEAKGSNDAVAVLGGSVAFRLHDTYGFPIDLTTEIAHDRGVEVDRPGFDVAMEEQRTRARAAAKGEGNGAVDLGRFREVLEEFGPTRFVGYELTSATGRVLHVGAHVGPAPGALAAPREDAEADPNVVGDDGGDELVDVVLDATPFYAEGGGQVGDTGLLIAPGMRALVLDTNRAVEGITRHIVQVELGELCEGSEVEALVDVERRDATRRNHTGTHLLHEALRHVLGEHAKQQGSLVGPDRLRFDFAHFKALEPEELRAIEDRVNAAVLADAPVEVFEASRAEAEDAGAVAFFGEKYGELVRVVRAGDVSIELCGGTHVGALGHIGAFRILSDTSIGANTRRIEATTGMRTIEHMRDEEALLERTSSLLHVAPAELEEATRRLLERVRELEGSLSEARAGRLREDAARLIGEADEGIVIARRDGLDPAQLRELALAVRAGRDVVAVGLAGSPEPGKVALVVAVQKSSGLDARPVASDAAKAVGGGGGGSPELATAGGKDASGIDEALARLTSGLRGASS